ncbi:MAG: pitrilysin family protein [Mariprofundaceae bacterium]|nr:pitrilysin family protein [Mariprofundaceae bacterium]
MKHIITGLWLCLLTSTAVASPAIEEAKLDNGLRVLLTEAHHVPMVAMQLVLPAGSRFDPEEKGGTASLLAAMLGDHSAKHDHATWSAWLDSEAVKLGSGASKDTMALSLTVLREALPQGLNMLSEALLQPGWRTKRLTILQQDAIAAATKAQESAGTRAAEYTAHALYGSHPYGHRTGGSMASLHAINMTDLHQLYDAQCKPQGAVLAVSGDITMKELLPLLETKLHDWQGAPTTAAGTMIKATKRPVHTQHIVMPTTQMLVQFSRLGIARSDADFFPVLVLNHLLGGSGFGSILMEEVREKRGLVYGVYSYVMPLLARGPFVITLQTRADQADKAVQVVKEQLQNMAEGHIDANRLDKTKGNLTGGFAQRMDSNRERVGLIAMIGFYHLPLNYLQQWTKRIESVNLADVKRAAKHYLPPKQWNIVQLGPVGENK